LAPRGRKVRILVIERRWNQSQGVHHFSADAKRFGHLAFERRN
jgi:hypothetical protein